MTALLLLLALWAAPAATPAYVPIAAARQQAQGTQVTVMGLVTVPPGRFRSSSSDEGFALHDQTGGIWVSVAKRLHLAAGQRVLVSGTLATNAGKLQIAADAANVKRLAGHAMRVATGQIGAATLGHVVTIEGTITKAVEDDLPYGYKLQLDDGSGAAQVYVNASTNIDAQAATFKLGRRLRVTGFASQYDTTYEVEPRSRSDVRPLR